MLRTNKRGKFYPTLHIYVENNVYFMVGVDILSAASLVYFRVLPKETRSTSLKHLCLFAAALIIPVR